MQPDVPPAVRAAENAPTSDRGRVHNFSELWDRINDMRVHNRGNGAQTQADLREMNARLHRDGVLPGIDIVGIGTERQGRQERHLIYTRDASGRVQAQYAERVDDRGNGQVMPRESERLPGQPSIAEREARAAMVGRMLGLDITPVPREAGGGYDVDIARQPHRRSERPATLLDDVLGGVLGGGTLGALGMNRWQQRAWFMPEDRRR